MTSADIQFYGERGIVNGLVMDIGNKDDKLNRFFGAIRLYGGRETPWKDGVTACRWLIEPDLAGFGNPDLIAVIDTNQGRFALFFEAKLLGYTDSCLTLDLPEKLKGQSSRLNVQLALRYRFHEAYRQRRDRSDPLCPVEEKAGTYLDGRHKPLRLAKPTVLQTLHSLFQGVGEAYFIALTNDRPGTESNWAPDPASCPPLFQGTGSQADNRFFDHAQAFGILTYQALMDAAVVDKDAGFFGAAWRMMGMGQKAPKATEAPQTLKDQTEAEENAPQALPAMRGLPFKDWNQASLAWAQAWFEVVFKEKSIRQEGSFSLRTPGGPVVMKLMAVKEEGDALYLGLRDNGRIRFREADTAQAFRGTVNGRPFYFFRFEPASAAQARDISKLALYYLESWMDTDT